jgi:branched-chain amino acid aminotransferase
VREVFACGTAAVVTAVGEVRHAAGEFQIGDGGEGPVTQRMRTQLTGIQRGRLADPLEWVYRID